jgi:hypothetical protein
MSIYYVDSSAGSNDTFSKTAVGLGRLHHFNNWFAALMQPVITTESQKKLDEDLLKLKVLVESQ